MTAVLEKPDTAPAPAATDAKVCVRCEKPFSSRLRPVATLDGGKLCNGCFAELYRRDRDRDGA